MKKLLLILAICLLTGCGGDEPVNKNTEKIELVEEIEVEEMLNEEETFEENQIGEKEESEFGIRTIIHSQKNLEYEIVQGPFRIKVTDIQVSDFVPSVAYRDVFNDKEILSIVTIAMEVENMSEKTNGIYPDQSIITTNTKEQSMADIWLSDSIGGDFIGNVVKSGVVIYQLDSKAEDINNIKLFISGGHDSNFNNLTDDFMFEFDF